MLLLLLLLRRRLLFKACLLTFGHISYSHGDSSYRLLLFNVYVRRTYGSLILPFVVFIGAARNAARVCALACVSEFGWTTTYLNNTYGFIRHGIRVVILHVWYVREKLLPGMTFLDAMITYHRSIARGRERLSCRKRQVLYPLRTCGSQASARQ